MKLIETFTLDKNGLKYLMAYLDEKIVATSVKAFFKEDIVNSLHYSATPYTEKDVEYFIDNIRLFEIPNVIGVSIKYFLERIIVYFEDYILEFVNDEIFLYDINN
ncbi:MAG TPA: hypothetical protein PKD00_00200 [Burkholderiales bacterium]|nr:hypothetical protein [Burkholderiales bacterium]